MIVCCGSSSTRRQIIVRSDEQSIYPSFDSGTIYVALLYVSFQYRVQEIKHFRWSVALKDVLNQHLRNITVFRRNKMLQDVLLPNSAVTSSANCVLLIVYEVSPLFHSQLRHYMTAVTVYF